MPTYIYSPSRKNNRSSTNRSNSSNTSNNASSTYKKTSQKPKTSRNSQSVNLLKMYMRPQMSNTNNSKTLRYKTTAPTFVNKRYIQRPNGGYTLEYNIKNAKVVTDQKPKLRFIKIAKLVNPQSLK